jgi:hypothetical protein
VVDSLRVSLAQACHDLSCVRDQDMCCASFPCLGFQSRGHDLQSKEGGTRAALENQAFLLLVSCLICLTTRFLAFRLVSGECSGVPRGRWHGCSEAWPFHVQVTCCQVLCEDDLGSNGFKRAHQAGSCYVNRVLQAYLEYGTGAVKPDDAGMPALVAENVAGLPFQVVSLHFRTMSWRFRRDAPINWRAYFTWVSPT